MNYWYTSDFHFSHKNIIKYCDRPFSSVEEMDEVIMDNLLSAVQPGDCLFFLGDLTFKKDVAYEFFGQMDKRKIQVHFILGNHDNRIENIVRERAASCSWMKYQTIDTYPIVMNHWNMRVWHKSHFNSWQLYGHSHGGLPPVGKQWDVGVDNNEFMPVSMVRLKRIMERQENNFNYIENR